MPSVEAMTTKRPYVLSSTQLWVLRLMAEGKTLHRIVHTNWRTPDSFFIGKVDNRVRVTTVRTLAALRLIEWRDGRYALTALGKKAGEVSR